MANIHEEIGLPDEVQLAMRSARHLFVSVTPLAALSDVLSLLSESDRELAVVSGASPVNGHLREGERAVVVCGDISLKELPGYLRERALAQSISTNSGIGGEDPWLALRVRIARNEATVIETLSSSQLDARGRMITDESWAHAATLLERLSHVKRHPLPYVPNQPIDSAADEDFYSDMEFID